MKIGIWSKIKRWIKEKWVTKKWLLWFIISVFELNIILYFHSDRVRNIVLKLVLDSNGNFNWASVTSLVAIMTIIIAWKNNNNSIKANIVSKSRIEWIQEVRKVSVEFLDACYNLTSLISVIKCEESQSVKPQHDGIAAAEINLVEEKGRYYQRFDKGLIDEQSKVKKIGALLTLYFGPDKSRDNEVIVYIIETIVLSISGNDKIFEQQKTSIEEIIRDLKYILRTYFKVEWKRSIEKLEGNTIVYELNNDAKYKAIINKYREQLENTKK